MTYNYRIYRIRSRPVDERSLITLEVYARDICNYGYPPPVKVNLTYYCTNERVLLRWSSGQSLDNGYISQQMIGQLIHKCNTAVKTVMPTIARCMNIIK